MATFKPFPNDKILNWSKFKAFADDKINGGKKLETVDLHWRAENIVGKGENAGYSIFSFSYNVFKSPSYWGC